MSAARRYLGSATVTIVALLVVATTAKADSWLITPGGSGDAPTIQAAIDSAAVGDTILLADGVFTGDGNRNVDLHSKDVVIRSLSGNPNACVVDCESTPSALNWGVRIWSGETAATVLQDFTITGAGKAVWIRFDSSPRIINCIIAGNDAETNGAGVYVGESSPTFANCQFVNNAALAGAVYVSRLSSPTFTNCTFAGNDGGDGGGGVCIQGSSPLFVNCVFFNNVAAVGGAVLVDGGSAAVFNSCTFAENAATEFGGAVYSDAAEIATFNQCLLAFNTDSHGAVAGNATFNCCNIFGNDGGDWNHQIDDQLGQNGNISVDPEFCGILGSGNLFLQSDSPCAAAPCGLMGALPTQCGSVATEGATWGVLKSRYRSN